MCYQILESRIHRLIEDYMKGIRDIKGRIKAVENTAQITRAMQLVAASKMKSAQARAKDSRPYALLLAEILDSLVSDLSDATHPLLKPREVKRRGVIIIATDKGLCGALNSNLFRLAGAMEESTHFVAIGRKGAQYLARANRNLIAEFSVPDECLFAQVRPAVEFMIEAYLGNKIDTLEVIYPRFINTLIQEPSCESLLPLSCLKEELEVLRKRLSVKGEEEKAISDSREIQCEPNSEAFLAELPYLFVKQEIYEMVLEAKASEHSSRMVAMKQATDNAKEIADALSLEYSKARQGAITKEIIELAAGSTNAENIGEL